MLYFDIIKLKVLLSINPFYIRSSLIGGSLLLIVYLIQVISGIMLGLQYSFLFESSLPNVIFLWWEVYFGSFLVRIHSEFGNILFLFLYIHILIKIFNNTHRSELDYTWISGIFIIIFTYIAGITGAIMPCSILAEVTATVIGYAINSLAFLDFDFLATPIIPGLGLTDDTMFRVFIFHGLTPIIVLIIAFDHLNNLHVTEYTDEEEMEIIFVHRLEYFDDFILLELFYWFEVLFFFVITRFLIDFFLPKTSSITYSMSNFEYWPFSETIDFALAVPHWYLRPLMSSLVVIPHHYLGFFYVILFFIIVMMLPFLDDSEDLIRSDYNSDYLYIRFPYDLDYINYYLLCTLIMLLAYTTTTIPTGRYYVSLGTNEFLVFCFWLIVVILMFGTKINSFIMDNLKYFIN